MKNLFKRTAVLVTAIALGILAIWIRGCIVDHRLPPVFSAPLNDETLAQTVVQDHHIAIRTHTDTKAAYVPDGGQATVSVNRAGTIDLNVQDRGLTLKPVLGLVVTDKARAGGGFQLAYWNRLELYVGGAFPHPTAFVGLGYRLDSFRLLQNTSLAVVYTSSKELGAALLVRF